MNFRRPVYYVLRFLDEMEPDARVMYYTHNGKLAMKRARKLSKHSHACYIIVKFMKRIGDKP